MTEPLSFRLSSRTVALLRAAAEGTSESRNALAERLLGEAVRTEQHPLIRFHAGAAGRRQPILTGTRLYVHQVIATLRGNDGSVADTADYLAITERQVRAALAYYADFGSEVDADASRAEQLAAHERSRWERQHQAIS